MIKVLGGYLTGAQETEIDGKLVKWDNAVLYCVTDVIPPDKVALGFFGSLMTSTLKFNVRTIQKIGFIDWTELINKEIEIIYYVDNTGKARPYAVKLVNPK